MSQVGICIRYLENQKAYLGSWTFFFLKHLKSDNKIPNVIWILGLIYSNLPKWHVTERCQLLGLALVWFVHVMLWLFGFFLCSVIRRMMKYLENITHLMTRYLESSQPHLSPNSVTCLTLFFCGESLSAIWLAKETELGLDSGCPTTCDARYISLSCIE